MIESLPLDIILYIFDYLEEYTVNLRLLNKNFKDIIDLKFPNLSIFANFDVNNYKYLFINKEINNYYLIDKNVIYKIFKLLSNKLTYIHYYLYFLYNHDSYFLIKHYKKIYYFPFTTKIFNLKKNKYENVNLYNISHAFENFYSHYNKYVNLKIEYEEINFKIDKYLEYTNLKYCHVSESYPNFTNFIFDNSKTWIEPYDDNKDLNFAEPSIYQKILI